MANSSPVQSRSFALHQHLHAKLHQHLHRCTARTARSATRRPRPPRPRRAWPRPTACSALVPAQQASIVQLYIAFFVINTSTVDPISSLHGISYLKSYFLASTLAPPCTPRRAMSSPAYSSSSSSASSDLLPHAPQPAPAAVVQQVNIRSHLPVLLDLPTTNYEQWRCLFESVLGKFSLDVFVLSAPPMAQYTAEWR